MIEGQGTGPAIKLSASGEKIYVRETSGRYTRWRWACVWITQLVFFVLPWLNWNGRKMVLLDFAARKFFIFNLVLWPQDLIYLTALLVICACTLFLSTAIVGRIWCGYACPHSVYTEIFLWIERKVEGGRSARMRLDQAPWTIEKISKKMQKHGAWGLLAFWIGITFVAYFTPIENLLRRLASLTPEPWESLWISFYALLAYINAGWMREQICRIICPYSRFQSAMFDRDSLIISYDAARGEPRGLRNRKILAQNLHQGDCIDCTLCVQVCPTGQDIRQGLHFDCMGCGACIDACNLVMDKLGAARGLVRYSTGNAIDFGYSAQKIRARLLRPRVLIYATLLVVMIAAVAASIRQRLPLKLDVMRDRGEVQNDANALVLENVYRLQIINTDEHAHRYKIAVAGVDTIRLETSDDVSLPAMDSRTVPARVSVARGKGVAGANQIIFEIQDRDTAALKVIEKSSFVVP